MFLSREVQQIVQPSLARSIWSVPRVVVGTSKVATRFPAASNLRMSPVQSAWPTYTFPAVSKAKDDGLQLYPLPKVPRRLPLASHRSTVLLGERQFPPVRHQCGTYRFPATSNATLLACPPVLPRNSRRKDPSGFRHCTRPWASASSDTNTSPPVKRGGPFETVTVTGF